MKKIYAKPELEPLLVEVQSILAGTEEPTYNPNQPTDPVPVVPGPWG